MGHREDLLEGAKKCLYEKGYARTTARDIVAASGTNLASIGYHYGSKEALMNAALFAAVQDFADALDPDDNAAFRSTTAPGSLERFQEVWTRILELGAANPRLWVANFELLVQAERVPEIRKFFADSQIAARLGIGDLFQDLSTMDESTRLAVGSIYHALLIGVMAQWLIAPQHAPTAVDMTNAMRTILENFRR